MNAIVFDTETTGVNEPEIIESSWIGVSFRAHDDRVGGLLTFGDQVTQRFRPKSPISMGAMAVHHIMDEDLAGCPPSATFKLPSTVTYLIGHNVDYDWVAAGRPAGVKLIDTLCMARRLWPNCDSHTLGALTYFLFRSTARSSLKAAHSAEADVLLTGNLLCAILSGLPIACRSFEQLWEFSEAARIPEVMPFGKHKGVRITDTPLDYRQWLLRQPEMDPYVKKAVSDTLKRTQ